MLTANGLAAALPLAQSEAATCAFRAKQVVQTEALRFPDDPPVSDDLKDLLSQMLHKVCRTC